jgi:prepilin-type N-terminal cleavage/methylation domain-containing protein
MHRLRERRARRGVTLLELIIALAIAGLAMLGCVMLLDQLNDSHERIVRDRAADATGGNEDRMLRRFLADAHTTTDTAERFRGDEHNASYLTLCDTPSGWPENCRVTLSLDSLRDSSVIVAEAKREEHLDDHLEEHFELRRIAGSATFRYLDLSSRDSSWVRQWATSIALPGAIALVVGGDTTILPLGSVRD